MYLPSNTPILANQRADAARHAAESDARIAAMRRISACGRARLFNTLINPNSIADSMGVGAGLDAAKLQQQTEASRASGILSVDGESAGPSVADIIGNAPEVVSLNRGGGCSRPSYIPVPLGLDPTPGMPQRAPTGLTGYAPPWSDAGVLPNGGVPQDGVGVGGWIMDHPWLTGLILGTGLFALSRRKGR